MKPELQSSRVEYLNFQWTKTAKNFKKMIVAHNSSAEWTLLEACGRLQRQKCKECLTRPQGERPDVTLIMYKQGKAHCMLSCPGAVNCPGLFTLLLMTPHCSRAVSTLFLSENILRMLKDRDSESAGSRSLSQRTQHQGGSGREKKGQEEKEEVEAGGQSQRRMWKWLKEADDEAAVSLFHRNLAVLIHLQLQLCVSAATDR